MSLDKSQFNLADMSFIAAFQEFQESALSIHKNRNFNAQDLLIEDFEKFFQGATVDLPTAREKYKRLFDDFRNARVGLKLMLSVSELSEALEAVRKNQGPDDHIPTYTAEEAEVADAVIRLMNYASDRKLRLAEAIVAKNEYNRTRPDHKPDARAAEHGKRF